MARERKADRVADDLLRRIVSGALAVGSLLPKEAELAEHYGVNRSVVREAIKLLEVHRLVEPIRRRGTEVLDPMRSLSPEVLRAMIAPGPGLIDLSVLRDVLEVRAELDVKMSCLAARRRTDADLEALDATVASLRDALGDRDRFEPLTDQLVRQVARATQNRIYEMLVTWHQTVATDLAEVFRATRPGNEPHLKAIEILVDHIRVQDDAGLEALLQAYHRWATPRLMAAAALHAGGSLERALELAHARPL